MNFDQLALTLLAIMVLWGVWRIGGNDKMRIKIETWIKEITMLVLVGATVLVIGIIALLGAIYTLVAMYVNLVY